MARIYLAVFAIAWLTACQSSSSRMERCTPAPANEGARAFALRFYQAHRDWGLRGVPFPSDFDRVSPFVTPEILALFKLVNRQRDRWCLVYNRQETHHPQAWRPEGDVFCGLYEGITHFSVGDIHEKDGFVCVDAKLENLRGRPGAERVTPWTDQLVLVRSPKGWRIADIVYGFGGSRMSDNHRDGMNEVGKMIRKGRSTELWRC